MFLLHGVEELNRRHSWFGEARQQSFFQPSNCLPYYLGRPASSLSLLSAFTMSHLSNRRDPPSAASIVLSNESTPTFSLNARQLAIRSNRERNRTENESESRRPFSTRSNRSKAGFENSENRNETRSLFSENYAKSRHSAESGARRSSTVDDGGLLRRTLEQAYHNSQQSDQSRASSHHTVSSFVNTERRNQHTTNKSRKTKKEPEETSIRIIREDPEESKPANNTIEQTQNFDRVAAIREAYFPDTEDDPRSDLGHSETRAHHPTIGGSTNTLLSAGDVPNRSPGEMEQPAIVETKSDKSVGSSVRRKLEDKKRQGQIKTKQKGNSSTATKISDKHSQKEMTQGKQSNEKTRQLIQEKMRQRKGIAGRSRDQAVTDEGFETFCRTLQHEATMSNSQVSQFSSADEQNRPNWRSNQALSYLALAKFLRFDGG